MPTPICIPAFMLFSALTFSAFAETSGQSAEPSEQYVREWLLCGPFPVLTNAEGDIDAIRLPGMYADFLASQGGEANARPVAGEVVSFPGGACTWKRHISPEDAVDLDLAVTKTDRVVAYAYATINSPTQQACILALGSNDGIRAWLNGEPVLDCPGPRGLQMDHNLVPVALRKGDNSLVLKIEERGSRWGFACRFLPLSHGLLAERLRLFDIVSRDDGTPVIRARHSQGLMAAMLKSAMFAAVSVTAPDNVLWTGDWPAGGELPIGVDSRNFSQYQLRIKTLLAEGAKQDLTLPFTAGRRLEHVLFDEGHSDYQIQVADDASESEKWAASELQHWLGEVGGAPLAVQTNHTDPKSDKVILVGWSRRAQKLLGPCVQPPKDEDESFTYRSVGSAVVIWGGKQRGTLYGVMSFLERELGVRFYTPQVTVAPKKARYAFTWLNHSEKPGVRVRNDFYYEAFEPIWAARNRVNGAMGYRKQPGGLEAYWSVHTFYPLMPPEEFFKDHPEYYSLIDGKRTADHAQLCLANPDVLRIITERIKRTMRELPEYLIYDVSQNDWSNPCQCPDCQAVVDREGSQSGPIIQFVNQVADSVKADFPDKFIGTLAYSYTRKPPKTLKPRENVVVRFCSIECCFAHDFTTCPENKTFVKDMNGWAAIAPHIYIWDYVVNFSHYLLPYPNFRVLQSNIQFFRDHKAIGIMEQAAYQCRGGEFAELRSYFIAKLLWDPEIEVGPVINDFMYGYYGRAGQYVRSYFDLLHGRLTPDTHIHLGLQHDDKLFSDEFIRQAETLFDQGETVADTEAIRRRVEMARLPIMYLKCKRSPLIANQDGTYARFSAIVKREGITHYAEAGEQHKRAFHTEVESAK
ncbi:MAG: DUF4838 domain-containing protein [Verrucomicrobia bacterium]|nr:DUF4838 domain-containing protein [Verrucomicrobiota bacterium]